MSRLLSSVLGVAGAAAVAVAACGGETFESSGGGSGGSSAGSGSDGSAGSAARGGSSSGGNGTGGGSTGDGNIGGGGSDSRCPDDVPAFGSTCDDGTECNYGPCCPTVAICTNGMWDIASAPCAPPECPPDAPIDGADCTCLEGLYCEFNSCSTIGQMARGTCEDNSQWNIEVGACRPGVENCYGTGLSCAPGEICTKMDDPGGFTQSCVPDPCWPEDLDCSCAEDACPPDHACEYINPWGAPMNAGHMWCRYTGGG